MKKNQSVYFFYLGHPAHYHNVSNLIRLLSEHGHTIKLIARGKDVLFELLDGLPYNITYLKARSGNGKLSLLASVLFREWRMFTLAVKYRPKMMIGTDIVITHIGRLLNIPSVILNEDDTEAVPLLANLGFKYASHVMAPECCDLGKFEHKKIAYASYHELAYLHRNYFKPDKQKVQALFGSRERYFILRFSSLNAHHDDGVEGIDDSRALQLIDLLEPHGQVWITSERPLNKDLEPYRIQIPAKEMHHALAFAHLYAGDSQTMTAEAAVLGTPALRFNDFVGKLGYLEELEHMYELTYGFKTHQFEQLVNKLQNLMKEPELKKKWKERQTKMLKERIDLTDFWLNFFEQYPKSFQKHIDTSK
ncbi:MAG: hypothetical protein RIC95_13485 [Vicingaceae bacterium]